MQANARCSELHKHECKHVYNYIPIVAYHRPFGDGVQAYSSLYWKSSIKCVIVAVLPEF